MFTDFEQTLASFIDAFTNMGLAKGILFALFFLAVWFLPVIAALFFNRRHLGKIFLANIPAIASWVAWFALLAWAVTGKMRDKRASKGTDKAVENSA
ncbi:superinfection immunity protein [Microbulbifer magnicolonia]|uniref:superinfection immunity protein n=1 Tax=Microbulbifer magnicolonia TaxID=3109744 RepID=UPI002B40B3E7|nr:superinfection immunity protein [Microbulbifer sp. GG15]